MCTKPISPVPVPSRSAAIPRSHRADLARLLPLWPQEIDDMTIEGRERVVRLLARALRQERCRGRRGHWAYDLARHAALARLYRVEVQMLNETRRAAPRKYPR